MNIPLLDDYAIYLDYLNEVWKDPLHETFKQHNEHRPVLERVTALLQYQLTGKINFRFLAFLGNFFLLLTAWLVWKQYRYKGDKYLAGFFIALLLFNLNGWENLAWATGALQNYTVVFFTLAGFYLTVHRPEKKILILLCSVLAFLASGSGVFAFGIIGFYGLLVQRKYIFPSVLIVAGVVIFVLHSLYSVQNPGHDAPLHTLLHAPGRAFIYFLTFLGSFVFGFGFHRLWSCQIFGGIIFLAGICYLVRYKKTDPFLLMVILFVFACGCIAALTRTLSFGALQAVSSRYQVLSLLLLLSIVLQFTGRIAARPVLLISAVCLALASYALSFHFNMRPLHYRAVKLRNSSYCHYRCDKAYDYMYPLQDQAEFILWKSEFLGIYTMPEYKGDYFCH